jgi:hypothetical protein
MKNDYDKFVINVGQMTKLPHLIKLKDSILYYRWVKQNQDMNGLITMNLSSNVGLKINYHA